MTVFPHQHQGIGDIARRAAQFFHHALNEEAYVQGVDFFRQNVLFKLAQKSRNLVINQKPTVDAHK